MAAPSVEPRGERWLLALAALAIFATRLPWIGAGYGSDPDGYRAITVTLMRVVKPTGTILWFDFRVNNPRNPNVRGIGASEIRSLFPGCGVRLRSVTLAPPIARFVVPKSWIAACMLEKIPFLRTHYLGLIRKPAK